ncbi:MAG: monovalent cation/H(+) antiporter subunit G [Lachnospiraceae bacterium]|nr:monovalent cation/H(+) antiporter subunit G [Lachnospiraceae bacterium]
MGIFDWIRLIIGSAFLICGLVIFFTEIFGVFHLNYVLNRMHAAAMGDTLGISSCLIGLMFFSGLNFTTLKLMLIVCFLWFTSPVSSHVVARLEVATNDNLDAHCLIYDDVKDLEAELAEADNAAAETDKTTGGEVS